MKSNMQNSSGHMVNLQNAFCGHYVLTDKLGEDRTCVYYAAHHSEDHTKRYQAKILKPKVAGDQRLVEHLHLEHDLLKQCDHPGVPRAYRVAAVKDLPCLITEAVEGPTLGEMYDDDQPFDHLAAWLAATKLVAAVHEQGYLINNLTADSFVLRLQDGVLFLQEWSRVSTSERGSLLTTLLHRKKAAFDTKGLDPDYLAPELATDGKCSRQSDVFALGELGFFLLGDHTTADGDATRASPGSDARRRSSGQLRSRKLRAHRREFSNLDAEVVAVIESCLRTSAAARPEDAMDLFEQLKPLYQRG